MKTNVKQAINIIIFLCLIISCQNQEKMNDKNKPKEGDSKHRIKATTAVPAQTKSTDSTPNEIGIGMPISPSELKKLKTRASKKNITDTDGQQDIPK
jgi:hypothetical protein